MAAIERRGRHRIRWRHVGQEWLIGLGVVFLYALFPSGPADARLLNLHGEVDLNYTLTKSRSGESDSTFSSLQETVQVGSSGELIREALGRYTLHFSFVNNDINHDGVSGVGGENRQVLDYYGSADLLPRYAPISLTAQRTTTEFSGEQGGSAKSVTTTYNLAWNLPRIWKLPELRVNLFYTVVDTGSCTPPPPPPPCPLCPPPPPPPPCPHTTRLFGGSISASDLYPYRYVFKNTELNWDVSFYSTQGVSGGGTNLNVAGRMTADSTWSPELKSNLRASYASGISHVTPSIPGGIATATTAGASVYYRPSLQLNSSAGYDFARDVVDRHIAGLQFAYRPTPQFDINGSGRILYLDLGQSNLLSVSGTGLVVYRPMLNLTTLVTETVGFNDTLGGADCIPDTPTPFPSSGPFPSCSQPRQSVFYNSGISASYFKMLELVRINTSGGLMYGGTILSGDRFVRTSPGPGGIEKRTLSDNNNTFNGNWSLQATNTKTQYVTTTGAYSVSYNRQSEASQEQWTNAVRFDANSSYFQELLLRGDRLSLHMSIGDILTSGTSDNSQYADLGTDASYGWRMVLISAGCATHISTQPNNNYNQYFTELQLTPGSWHRLSSHLGAKYQEVLFQNGINQSTFLGNVNLGYQLGLVQFSAQYQYSYQTETSTSTSHNLYMRLSRPFSL